MIDLGVVLFVALALGVIYGAFDLQEQMKDCARWRRAAWLLLSVVLGWKAADAVLYGAPAFPASDWLLLIALTLFLLASRQIHTLSRLIKLARRAFAKTPS